MKGKQYLIGAAAAVLGMTAVCTANAAENAWITSANENGITVEADNSRNAEIVMAQYSKSGRLTAVKTKTVALEGQKEQTLTYNELDFAEDGYFPENSKVMLWDLNKAEPMSQSKPAVIPERTQSVKINLVDFVSAEVSGDNTIIRGCNQYGTEEKYKVADDAAYTINGFNMENEVLADISKYIYKGSVGSILLSEPDESGVYHCIQAEIIGTAIVSKMDKLSDGSVKLYFEESFGMSSIENMDISENYKITLNGEEISSAQITEGDILSFRYDVRVPLKNLETVEVMVSRDTFNAKVAYTEERNGVKYITTKDGGEYCLPTYEKGELAAETFTFRTDSFGNIFSRKRIASVYKYGVAEDVYIKDDGSYEAIIISPDNIITAAVDTDTYYRLCEVIWKNGENVGNPDKKAAVEERVVKYSINSLGRLRATREINCVSGSGKYSDSLYSLGDLKLNNITRILDLSEYEQSGKVYELKKENLIDGKYYGFAVSAQYDTENETSYDFVVISDKPAESVQGSLIEDITVKYTPSEDNYPLAEYSVYSPMAIYDGRIDINDSNIINSASVYKNGGWNSISFAPGFDCKAFAEEYKCGDVFFYKTDNDGYVTETKPMLKLNLNEGYQSFYQKTLENDFDVFESGIAEEFANEFKKYDDTESCELVFGAVMASDTIRKTIMIADSDALDENGIADKSLWKTYKMDDDVKRYQYDYTYSKGTGRLGTGFVSNKITESFCGVYADNEQTKADFNATLEINKEEVTEETPDYGTVCFAAAKVINGAVTEILMIVPDYGYVE